MWKITEHVIPKTKQELEVKIMLRDLAERDYITYSESFENYFKLLIKKIPRTNNFSADLIYSVTPRNLKSVEVWKMAPNGDFKRKMFTLDYIEP